MAQGIIPSGDGWKIKSFGIGSASTKGDLLSLNPARTTRPYTSVDTQYVGVGLHDSISSLPDGQMLVAIPSVGAEATVDVPTGLVSSALSFGQVYSIYGSGARTSFLTTLFGSTFSQMITVEGAPQTSQASRILVSFRDRGVIGSQSTNTFLT